MNAISDILCSTVGIEVYSRYIYTKLMQPEVNIPCADRGHNII